MKTKLLSCLDCIPYIASFFLSGCSNDIAEWRISEEKNPWQEINEVKMVRSSNPDIPSIIVFPEKQFQVIDGWGGSFNEQGYAALLALPENKRIEVIKEIFDAENGLKFNICRTPVGASDFTVDNIVNLEGRYNHIPFSNKFDKYYSYDDFPGDFNMEHFSVDRDTAFLIPYIRLAQSIRPDLKIWASPWTPPQWMKTDFHQDRCVKGECWAGFFKGYYGGDEREKYSDAYAKYFVRYIQAYRDYGVPVSALHVQNEFSLKQYWTSCEWTGSDLGDFYVNHLIPALRKNTDSIVKNLELWHGTIHPLTTDTTEFYKEIKPALDMAGNEITGAGFQWKGVNFIEMTKDRYPGLKFMATETRCGDGSNDWEYAVLTWNDMKEYLSKGVNAYMQWNMILDQVGKSSYWVGFKQDFWKQSAMITINVQTKEVLYNPQFYAVKHFSYYVQPGARLIKTSGTAEGIDAIGFINPDKSIVIELFNSNDDSRETNIICGKNRINVRIPKQSINTFIL